MIWTTRPRSDFGALRAIRAGDGPQALLLHGVGLRAEAWTAQIDTLSARFRVIAPDMPGHGESAPFAGQPSLSDYVDRVAAALDGPVWLAGHSMGAMIALELAHRFAERVRGVAALNAVFRRAPDAAAAIRARAAALNGVEPPDPSDALARWFGSHPSPERAACAAWLRAVDPSGYKAAYAVFAHADGPDDAALQALRAPALFLTGAEDPNSTPAMSAAMAAQAPLGAHRVIDGAAHVAPMTHAAQVSAALDAFFQETAR